MDYTTGWALAARRFGQRLGILRPAARLYHLIFRTQYEEAFDRAVCAAIRRGDTVWDVGANEGIYCVKFAELVGAAGRVIGFEPSPGTAHELTSATQGYANILVMNEALSDVTGKVSFYIDPSGRDSVLDSLTREAAGTRSEEVQVQVRRGDEVALEYPPNIIKIDVEGYELEVLRGLQQTLFNPTLRAVAVEVHFLTLAKREAVSDAPRAITEILRSAGFGITWTDPSHLIASR